MRSLPQSRADSKRQLALFAEPITPKVTNPRRPPKPVEGEKWWCSFVPPTAEEWASFIAENPRWRAA